MQTFIIATEGNKMPQNKAIYRKAQIAAENSTEESFSGTAKKMVLNKQSKKAIPMDLLIRIPVNHHSLNQYTQLHYQDKILLMQQRSLLSAQFSDQLLCSIVPKRISILTLEHFTVKKEKEHSVGLIPNIMKHKQMFHLSLS